MKKLLFIYNTKAGKAQLKNKLPEVLDIFTKAGYLVTVWPTQRKGDAVRTANKLGADFDLVVCGGGDGTLDEVITGLTKGKVQVPVGYIPAGSTNDFGGSLRIPKDMLEAARVAVNGRRYACDIGTFNEDIFVYIAAFGLFTDVSYETNQQVKNVLGHMAYLLEGMKRLSAIQSYELSVSYEDVKIEGEFIFGMITNSLSVGGFKKITGKNVVLDDGVFEVTLIKRPSNPMELNRIMSALMNQDIDTDCMYCFRTKKLMIESRKEIAWTLDGEYGGSHKKIMIENKNRAQEILVPEREAVKKA